MSDLYGARYAITQYSLCDASVIIFVSLLENCEYQILWCLMIYYSVCATGSRFYLRNSFKEIFMLSHNLSNSAWTSSCDLRYDLLTLLFYIVKLLRIAPPLWQTSPLVNLPLQLILNILYRFYLQNVNLIFCSLTSNFVLIQGYIPNKCFQ